MMLEYMEKAKVVKIDGKCYVTTKDSDTFENLIKLTGRDPKKYDLIMRYNDNRMFILDEDSTKPVDLTHPDLKDFEVVTKGKLWMS